MSVCSTCAAAPNPTLLVQWQRVHGRLVHWFLCPSCFLLEQKQDAALKAERETRAIATPKRRAS